MGAYKYWNPATQKYEIIKSKSIIKEDGSLEYTPDDIKGIDNKINNLSTDVESHKADYTQFKNNVEQIKINDDDQLEVFNGTEWIVIKGGVPVGNVSGFSAKAGNAKITLKWSDPEDVYLDSDPLAVWAGTKIVRKTGSYPTAEDDGDLVVDSTERNKYESDGYEDTGLENETKYYYMAFPYTEDGLHTIDGVNRVSATPSIWIGDYYKEGNEYTDTTGGWEPFPKPTSYYDGATGIAQKEVDHLYLNAGNSSNIVESFFVTAKTLDFKNINTVYMDVEYKFGSSSSGGQVWLIGTTDKTYGYSLRPASACISGGSPSGIWKRETLEMSVENLSGMYYIKALARDGNPTQLRRTEMKVHRIWGE